MPIKDQMQQKQSVGVTRKSNLNAFLCCESGLTIVEYALAGALIGVGLIAAFTDLGATIASFISDLKDAIEP